jgi:hypothetical protein
VKKSRGQRDISVCATQSEEEEVEDQGVFPSLKKGGITPHGFREDLPRIPWVSPHICPQFSRQKVSKIAVQTPKFGKSIIWTPEVSKICRISLVSIRRSQSSPQQFSKVAVKPLEVSKITLGSPKFQILVKPQFDKYPQQCISSQYFPTDHPYPQQPASRNQYQNNAISPASHQHPR